MNRNIIFIIILLTVFYFVFLNNTENFWSRPNKCFDCEKNIKSIYDAHLAFPSKCFDCEKQSKIPYFEGTSKIPYFEGPTKCSDCDNNLKIIINKGSCMPVDNTKDYKF